MKNLKYLLILLVCLTAMVACQKTITPPLNNASGQLVIEGVVADITGPYHVQIYTTVNFYANNVFPGVSGATVMITDQTSNVTDQLTETTPGIYITHTITGQYGHTYLLTVVVKGKTYTATSTMPQPVKLDSVSFDYSDIKQIRPVLWYQDPVQVHNYYQYSLSVNGVFQKKFQTFDDRLSNGRYIRDKIDVDTGTIRNHNIVKVNLTGLDQGAYTFLYDSDNVAYNNGSLAAPVTAQSNIIGGCIGYFSAQTVSSKTGVVSY